MEFEQGSRKTTGSGGFAAWPEMAPKTSPPEETNLEFRETTRALAILKELDVKVTEESLGLMPILLSFLKQDAPVVVRRSIVSGTRFFSAVLEEMALQLHKSGKLERWLEELWAWMVKFKDAVRDIALETDSVGTKVLAVKFLEICVLLFTSEGNVTLVPCTEGKRRNFNVSWLVGGHPFLDPELLAFEASKTLGLLLDLLQSANFVRGSLTIVIINCLAAIGRNRPLHYNCIMSALLRLDPNFESLKGGHAASIRYSLRTAFLGFLRCTHPSMIESQDNLLRALRAITPAEGIDQIIRQVEKTSKSIDRISLAARFSKDDQLPGQISACGDLIWKRPVVQASDSRPISDDMPDKRMHLNTAAISAQPAQSSFDFVHDDDAVMNGYFSKASVIDSDLPPVEKMIAMTCAFLAEGERGAKFLDILISNIHPDLLADIVIENMKQLPENPLPLSGRHGNLPVNSQTSSSSAASQVESAATSTVSVHSSGLSSKLASTSTIATGVSISRSYAASFSNLLTDFKRDPGRDPCRLDPHWEVPPVGLQPVPLNLQNIRDMQSGLYHSLSKPILAPEVMRVENPPLPLRSISELEHSESSVDPTIQTPTSKQSLVVLDDAIETEPSLEVHSPPNLALSPVRFVDQ